MTNQKQVKYYPYTITGEQAEQAATALEQEERNLDRLYEGIAPDRTGYEESRIKILEKIKKEFNVTIS